jgi:hypothetical protein
VESRGSVGVPPLAFVKALCVRAASAAVGDPNELKDNGKIAASAASLLEIPPLQLARFSMRMSGLVTGISLGGFQNNLTSSKKEL